MLRGKDRRYLRSLAVNMDAIFQIGKGGIGENMIVQLNDALEARELIKIKVLNNCDEDAKSLGLEIAEATESELVQVIGRNLVLFRFSKTKRQIELPK